MSSPPPAAQLANRPASFGGIPTTHVDVPICAVLLACYVALAATHMTIYRRNLARKRRFRPSVMMFGFCMARITTFSVRIAWACHQANTNLALASGIFVAAGVLLLWIVNRIFATRLLAEYHPKFDTRQPWAFIMNRLPYIIVIAFLPMLITVVVLQTRSPSASEQHKLTIILKVALAYFVAFTFSPFFVPLWLYVIPTERTKEEVFLIQQRTRTGSTITKMSVVLVATSLLITELAFRMLTSLQSYTVANAPWYYSKATFYVVIPGFEILVLTLFAASRVDRLFYKYGPDEALPPPLPERIEML